MKTLFLGGSGFVGKSLVKCLSTDHEINLLVKHKIPDSNSNIKNFLGDLRDRDTLNWIEKNRFKRVIDASWVGLPKLDPIRNLENYQLKNSLIQFFEQIGIEEYIGFGSCLEYGTRIGKVTERDKGYRVGDFGKTKLAILRTLQESKIKFTWFRPFYLIGPNQHENSLLKSAIRNYSMGLDFNPREGNKTFDYITIEDAVAAMKLVIEKGAISNIYNVGSGKLFAVAEIINLVRREFGRTPIEYAKLDGLIADTTKLRSETGWTIRDDVREKISEIIQEIRTS